MAYRAETGYITSEQFLISSFTDEEYSHAKQHLSNSKMVQRIYEERRGRYGNMLQHSTSPSTTREVWDK
jgi:hypothetical protein